MTITALPTAPLITDSTATFNTRAFALVAALNTFVTEANALGVSVTASAAAALASQVAALASQTAAASAANFKGDWSTLTGALSIPASVSYSGKVWLLTVSVSNVTTEVPGVSSKWLPVSVNFASPDPIGSTTPSSAKFTHAYSPTITLTDASSIAWDVSTGQVAKVTLGGNRTMAAPSNLSDGECYTLNIIQDGTGSRVLTWNSVFAFTGGVAPTLSTSASAVDKVSFQYDGSKLRELGRSLGTA